MFFHFSQNNSGGHFDEDANVSHHVIIEAESAAHANERAEECGLYFDGCDAGIDCSCCGDRWDRLCGDESGDAEPKIYRVPAREYVVARHCKNGSVRVHYLDGRVDAF
ncbi:MAG TPA: hypothetical protein VF450_02885 [Noviherbaspirillum sp.]